MNKFLNQFQELFRYKGHFSIEIQSFYEKQKTDLLNSTTVNSRNVFQ